MGFMDWLREDVMDDIFGMNPPEKPSYIPPVTKQYLGAAPTLSAGLTKKSQKRAKIEAIEKRMARGAKRRGKAMLTIAPSKPFVGAGGGSGFSINPTLSPLAINYG